MNIFKKFFRSKMTSDTRTDNVIPPNNFFDTLKSKQHNITLESLNKFKSVVIQQANDFMEAGQLSATSSTLFHAKCISREQEAISKGFTTYILCDDLEYYIESVSQKVVKITEFNNFDRPIPKEVISKVKVASPIFDQLYIVFTDYTGKFERKVERSDRAQDPILLGAFKSKDSKVWNHRFYYIADWVDEYCDLTLDKYMSDMLIRTSSPGVHYTAPCSSVEELELKLLRLVDKG